MIEFLKQILRFFFCLHRWGPYSPIEYSGRGTIYRRRCDRCTIEETVYPQWRKLR